MNASPSLTANTNEDYLMKTEMLHGMLDVVDMDSVGGEGEREEREHFRVSVCVCLGVCDDDVVQGR